MARPKPRNSTVTVFEKALATGSGELADGNATNNSDPGELFGDLLKATGGNQPYTFSLIGSGTGTYGTLTLNANGTYS